MTPYLSNKLKVISIILSFCVVFVHAQTFEGIYEQGNMVNYGYNAFIQFFLTNGICRIATPMFALLAGFLFFFRLDNDHPEYRIKRKIYTRFKTLFLPYIFWAVLWIILYFFLQQFSPGLFEGKPIEMWTLKDYYEKIFVMPIPFQLWFLNSLFQICLLSPLIYYYSKHFPCLSFTIVSVLFWVDVAILSIDLMVLNFFTAGSIIGLHYEKLRNVNFNPTWLIPVWISLAAVNALDGGFNPYLYKLIVYSGIISFWKIYDVIAKRRMYKIPALLQNSFIVYLLHIPLITLVRKIFYYSGESELIGLLSYFASPVVTILICLGIGYVCCHLFPKCYTFVTGKR